MILILNFIFAVVGYLLADYLLYKARADQPIRVILAVLAAVAVFICNFARYFV